MPVQTAEYSPETRPVQLLDDGTGQEIPTHGAEFLPEDLFPGNVLTIKDGGAKRHYLVKSVEGDPPDTARIVPAKSSLNKGLLLLVVLAAAWFAIRYAIRLFT